MRVISVALSAALAWVGDFDVVPPAEVLRGTHFRACTLANADDIWGSEVSRCVLERGEVGLL